MPPSPPLWTQTKELAFSCWRHTMDRHAVRGFSLPWQGENVRHKKEHGEEYRGRNLGYLEFGGLVILHSSTRLSASVALCPSQHHALECSSSIVRQWSKTFHFLTRILCYYPEWLMMCSFRTYYICFRCYNWCWVELQFAWNLVNPN